jgi:hypothetical protein
LKFEKGRWKNKNKNTRASLECVRFSKRAGRWKKQRKKRLKFEKGRKKDRRKETRAFLDQVATSSHLVKKCVRFSKRAGRWKKQRKKRLKFEKGRKKDRRKKTRAFLDQVATSSHLVTTTKSQITADDGMQCTDGFCLQRNRTIMLIRTRSWICY